MKFIPAVVVIVLLAWAPIHSQDIYYTREGKVSFFSEAPLENIEAHNNRASSVFNAETCEIEFSVLIKGFMFEKSLMQEHFNENFMESHKFPRAEFKGTIQDCGEIQLDEEGTYPFKVTGDLEIRGISRNIEAEGAFSVGDGAIIGKSGFEVKVADYDIHIPAVVRDNIAREIEITIEANYKKLDR